MWKSLCLVCLAVVVTARPGVCESLEVMNLAKKIQVLDDRLYHTMVSLPPGQGQQFIKDIHIFTQCLRQMIDLVTLDKNGTREALELIIKRGHPKFLDTPFTDTEKKRLLDNFGWTVDDLERLYADRATAYTYWTDLLLIKNDYYMYDVTEPIIIPGKQKTGISDEMW